MHLIKVLGLDAKETSFGVRSFTAKVARFWLAELLIFKLDQERASALWWGKVSFPAFSASP